MSMIESILADADLGFRVSRFLKSLIVWSSKTFGNEFERGPVGALKHLEKEAREAQNEPTDLEEYADIFILLCDALWRVGFTFVDLINAVETKHEKNKKRNWPKNVDPNEPVEHIK